MKVYERRKKVGRKRDKMNERSILCVPINECRQIYELNLLTDAQYIINYSPVFIFTLNEIIFRNSFKTFKFMFQDSVYHLIK